MGLKEMTYYAVECDYAEPDGSKCCGVRTGDLGDYSAWADRGTALDEWRSAGGSYDTETGKALCFEHVPKCPHCGDHLDEDHRAEDCAPPEHAHVWGKPWVGGSGNRIYTCLIPRCTVSREEGGPGTTPKLGD